MPRTVRFRGLLLILVLFSISSPLFAAGRREPERPSVRAVVSTLWQTLVKLVPGLGDSSGTMDPDGKPQLFNGTAVGTDSSGTMDPDGQL